MQLSTANAIIGFGTKTPSKRNLRAIYSAAHSIAKRNGEASQAVHDELMTRATESKERIIAQRVIRKNNKRAQSAKGHRGGKSRGMKAR